MAGRLGAPNDDHEVDHVIELDDGRILAFEVKADQRVPGADFKGLRSLRASPGTRFIAGVALSAGPRSYTYADRLHVMPHRQALASERTASRCVLS